MINRNTFKFQQEPTTDQSSQTIPLDEIEQEELIEELEQTSIAQEEKSRVGMDVLILTSITVYTILTLNSLRHSSPLTLVYIILLLSQLPFLSTSFLNSIPIHSIHPILSIHSRLQPNLLRLLIPLLFPPAIAFYIKADSTKLAIFILPPMVAAMVVVRVEEQKDLRKKVGELKKLKYGLKGA